MFLGPLLLHIPKDHLNQFKNREPPYMELSHKSNNTQKPLDKDIEFKNLQKNENSESKSKTSNNTTDPSESKSKTSNTTEPSESWQHLPPHPDEDQVSKDTNRAFTFYPFEDQEERDKYFPKLQKELDDLIVAVLRRNPQLSYYQGYHDIATVVYLVFGAQEAIPILEYISLNFLRDFMMPSIDASIDHLNLISTLLEVADTELWEVISQANPFYAISPIITILTHNVASLDRICIILDFLFATHNMTIPIYLYASIVKHEKLRLLPFKNDVTNEVDRLLSSIVEDLPDNDSVVFDIISLASGLLERYPPQTLHSWDNLSTFSVLKTSAAPSGILDSYFLDCFHKENDTVSDNSTIDNKSQTFSHRKHLSNTSKTHSEFEDLTDNDNQLLFQYPNSPTFPTEQTILHGLNHSGSDISSRNSVSSINCLQNLQNETLPTPDERAYEYFQFYESVASSFPQAQNAFADSNSKFSESIGSADTQYFDRPSTIASPNSLASSVTSVSGIESNICTSAIAAAIGSSFIRARDNSINESESYGETSIFEKEPEEYQARQFDSDDTDADDEHEDEVERNTNDNVDLTATWTNKAQAYIPNLHFEANDVSERLFVFPSEELQKPNIKQEIEKTQEKKLINISILETKMEKEMTKYSIEELKLLLAKQVRECKQKEDIKKEKQAKRLEELRKKRAEEAAKRKATKESQNSDSVPLHFSAAPISQNLYHLLTLPSSLIYNTFSASHPNNRVLPHYLANPLPTTWTEGASIISNLFQTSKNGPGLLHSLSSSLGLNDGNGVKDNNVENNEKHAIKQHENDKGAQAGYVNAHNKRILSTFYLNSTASATICVGVIGILVAWYLNRHGVTGLKTMISSPAQFFRDMYKPRLTMHDL